MRQLLQVVASILLAVFRVNAETSLDHPFDQSFTKLAHAPCVSLFYRNGRVGCGTDEHSVTVGELKYYQGALPSNQENPFVMVVEDYDLTAETIDVLSAARGALLQGVLIVNSTKNSYGSSSKSGSSNQKDTNTYYSPDSQTPMGYNTPSANLNYGYKNYPWNPKGQNLFAYDLRGIPMAYIPDSEVADIIRMESQQADGSSAVVAEFNYYMGPEGINSMDCLQWKDIASGEWSPKCLPLGGTSVWATAGSPPSISSNNGRELQIEEEIAENIGNDRELANNYNNQYNANNKKQTIMLAAGMDTASMFHDVSPGANTAASNILTMLMAAKLIGANMDDQTLDKLPKRIMFALFEGETYGFLGSRSFLRDFEYPGFKCYSSPVRAIPRLGEKSEYACLNPLRPSLKFADLGLIAGMISVDQIGHAVSDGIFYVHADQNNDQVGAYLANVLKYSATSKFSVASSSAGGNNNNNNNNNNNYGFPYPPTPLTSVLNLSGGKIGGAVLTGYDYAFTSKVPYHSHRNSVYFSSISFDTIAAAATIVARAAVAYAYDDGSNDNGGYQNVASYAKNIIPELSSKDEDFLELANCLFYDGSCSLISKYSEMERANEAIRTGLNTGTTDIFPNPPSFYVGVFNKNSGQPFVKVGDNYFGAYNGSDFGKKNADVVGMRPRQLESAIYGLFNDYLGRGSTSDESSPVSCKKESDCVNVKYCQASGDYATCTGRGECVCRRAHYHLAVDEALEAAPNMPQGYFQISDKDEGISAMYTEPFWSPTVGVRVYRDVGSLPGFMSLVAGVTVGAASLFGALVLKVGLKKEKLY